MTAPGRYQARLVLSRGGEISGDAIRSLTISASALGSTDRLALGSSPAATLSGVVYAPGVSLLDQTVALYIGRQVSGALEEVPLGRYTITGAQEVDGAVTITGYDAMYAALETAYYPTISGPTTAQAVLADVAKAAELSLVCDSSVADVSVSGVSIGYTLREMAGYMAALMGGNARIDGAGALRVGWFTPTGLTLDGDQIYAGGAALAPENWSLGRLTCSVTTTTTTSDTDDDGNTIISSTDKTVTLTAGDGATGISLSNPWMTQEVLDGIFGRIGGFDYRAGQVSALADLRIEPGDLLTVVDSSGARHSFPVMSQTLEYDGGLRMTLGAWAESASDGGGNGVAGPLTQAVERFTAQLAMIKQLEAENLTAVTAKIAKLVATTAKVEDLTAIHADIDSLEARTAEIEEAYIDTAAVQTLLAGYAKIDQLEAAQADIDDLEVSTANIETLLAGEAGVGLLQVIHLTGKNVVIDDAIITDAMIADLSAGKLTAGRINTDLIQVASDSGRLVLDGETIQISDAQRVRVQLGRDASADYNLYLWDAQGNLMWDAGGLYAPGLHNGIIRDVAVAEDAAISGSKLDITSVASRLTEDGTLVVDSSRVRVDETTLDVAYKTVSDNTAAAQQAADQAQEAADKAQADIKAVESRTTTLETNLNVVQGQITSKIWQTDITEITDPLGGKVTALEDQYSQIDQTLGRIDLSVGDLQTKVDDQGTQIESVTGKLSLYVEKTDNGQIVSMLNASADMISLAGNRVTIDSDKFKLAADGSIEATGGTIGGWSIYPGYLLSDVNYDRGQFSGNVLARLSAGTEDEMPGIYFHGSGSGTDADSANYESSGSASIKIGAGFEGTSGYYKAINSIQVSVESDEEKTSFLIGDISDFGLGAQLTGGLLVTGDIRLIGKINGAEIEGSYGTVSNPGTCELTLGNGSVDVNKSVGSVKIYGGYSYYAAIKSGLLTKNRELLLPDAGGTILSTEYVGDFVVAQGTSGSWKYCKWSKGLAICFTTIPYTNSNWATQTWGSDTCTDDITFPNYPFTFLEEPICYASLEKPDGESQQSYFFWPAHNSTGSVSKPPKWCLVRPDGSPGSFLVGHPRIKMVAIGRWK